MKRIIKTTNNKTLYWGLVVGVIMILIGILMICFSVFYIMKFDKVEGKVEIEKIRNNENRTVTYAYITYKYNDIIYENVNINLDLYEMFIVKDGKIYTYTVYIDPKEPHNPRTNNLTTGIFIMILGGLCFREVKKILDNEEIRFYYKQK